jgi:hypothetical protein
MDELHVHTMAGGHMFSKNIQAISKTWCQKSDIKKVHKMKLRHSVGVVAHDLKVP